MVDLGGSYEPKYSGLGASVSYSIATERTEGKEAMLDPHHLNPPTRAFVACTVFALAGAIGGLLAIAQSADAGPLIALIVFYTTLTINTYESVKLFAAITPADDAAQRVFDYLLVLIYLGMAYSLRSPLIFLFTTLFFFIVAPMKYSNLLGRIPHPKLLKRKITILLLGTLLVAGVTAGAVLGFLRESAWCLTIVFGMANVYWLIVNPMYRIID